MLLFVVLWLVLSDLVSLVLPESLADMDSTLLPVFCSLTVSLTPLGLLALTVLSLLQMTYSRLKLFLLDLSLLVSLNYSRADWLVRPAHLLPGRDANGDLIYQNRIIPKHSIPEEDEPDGPTNPHESNSTTPEETSPGRNTSDITTGP